MNASQRTQLPKCARQVVREAEKSGALDRGEFTMGNARRAVAERLGLSTEVAKQEDVKSAVKEAINDALASADGDEESNEEDDNSGANNVADAEEEAEEEDEEDEEDAAFSPSEDEEPAPKKKRQSASRSRTTTPQTKGGKKNGGKARPSSKSAETIEDSDEEAAGTKSVQSSRGKKRAASSEPPSPARSESEMSSVYDEVPTKRRASKGSGSDKTKKAAKTKKDPNEGLSPDEARVADLKRIVVACGVRKQWSKELADAPTPKAQISHLLSLLQSLGMKGNPTLGKAKSLRERRELAQELSDVKEFEAERGLSGTERPRRTRGAARADSDSPPPPPKSGAMAAVMDFLSDDDD